MKNKIQDLRNHLFAALEELQDPDSTVPVEKILATANIGAVIVNTAKLELQYLKHFNSEKPSEFIQLPEPKLFNEKNN